MSPKHHKKHHSNGGKFTTESVEPESSQLTFVSRISSIPLLHDSVTTVTSYVKSAPYGEYIYDKSVNTFSSVQKLAQPYVEPVHARLQPHISKVDEYAVKALDNIEQKFPVVKQPTSEIIDSVTKPPRQYYEGVKKTVETNVTEPATQAATTLAKGVNQRASVIVDKVEAVVERWLPAENVPRASSEENSNQVVRLYDITASLPVRVTTLVNTQLDQHNIPHTTEDFIKLRDASTILRETHAKIENLNTQLAHWVAISKDLASQKVGEARTIVVNGFDTTVTTVTANERVQFYTQELASTIEKAAIYAKHRSESLPESVQTRLNPLLTFVNDQYQLVSVEIKRTDILPSEKAKNILLITQQQVLPILKKSVDDFTAYIKSYQLQYYTESEKVLENFKAHLKGFGVPVK